MNDKNNVVIIELDRPRELRFGHKAIKKMTAILNVDLESFDVNKLELEEIEKVMYCGLLSDAKENNETLKIEDMEDLLDKAKTFTYIIEKLEEAFTASFGEIPDEKN